MGYKILLEGSDGKNYVITYEGLKQKLGICSVEPRLNSLEMKINGLEERIKGHRKALYFIRDNLFDLTEVAGIIRTKIIAKLKMKCYHKKELIEEFPPIFLWHTLNVLENLQKQKIVTYSKGWLKLA